ncbi:hypothetical protein ACLOJK_038285 [Asimina triloba]
MFTVATAAHWHCSNGYILAWIKAMIENGGRLKVREATSPATEEMEPSLCATAVDGGLRPRRIWGWLIVADMMGGLDYLMESPSLMGLPETNEVAAATVGMVEMSLLLAGGCRIWNGSPTPSF